MARSIRNMRSDAQVVRARQRLEEQHLNGNQVVRAGSNSNRRKVVREDSITAKRLTALAKRSSDIADVNKSLSSDSESDGSETAAPTTDEVSEVGVIDCSLWWC